METKLYGLWSHEETWCYLSTGEIFWTEHERVAKAQIVKMCRLFGKDWGQTWTVREIGENGRPVFEFEPLDWDSQKAPVAEYEVRGDGMKLVGGDVPRWEAT